MNRGIVFTFYIAKEYPEIINEDKEKATLILNIRNFLEAMDKEKK